MKLITDADYFSDRFFLRHGWLESFRRSPALFRQAIEQPVDEPSDAMRIGSAVHCWLLERDQFYNRFAIAPAVDRRTKDGKAQWIAFEELHGDKAVLSSASWSIAQRAIRSAESNRAVQSLLRSVNRVEQVVAWHDPETGFACKAKLDGVIYGNDTPAILIDVKTTSTPYPEDFQRNIWTRGYHRQAAWYSQGMRIAYGLDSLPDWFFVAISTTEPFESFVYRLSPDSIDIGMSQNRQTLDALRECVESDQWCHLASTGVTTLDLPAWALKGVFNEC